jgi:hypothetical protein
MQQPDETPPRQTSVIAQRKVSGSQVEPPGQIWPIVQDIVVGQQVPDWSQEPER